VFRLSTRCRPTAGRFRQPFSTIRPSHTHDLRISLERLVSRPPYARTWRLSISGRNSPSCVPVSGLRNPLHLSRRTSPAALSEIATKGAAREPLSHVAIYGLTDPAGPADVVQSTLKQEEYDRQKR